MTAVTAAPPLLEMEGAGKRYFGPDGSDTWALRGVNLRVDRGEVVGLLGPNRAGKTTAAKLILSLCKPTEGRVRRLGRPASDRGTLASIGYMHEAPAFPRDLTAPLLLHYSGALALVPPAVLRARVPMLLERVGLADRGREAVGRFSKGMLQRLGLAQALLTDPDLLILDEPAEGLDIDGRSLVRDVVNELRDRDKGVLLITHSPAEVERLCDRVAVLALGRKVFDGPLDALEGSVEVPGGPADLEACLSALYRKTSP